jgi:hypothetical protein
MSAQHAALVFITNVNWLNIALAAIAIGGMSVGCGFLLARLYSPCKGCTGEECQSGNNCPKASK